MHTHSAARETNAMITETDCQRVHIELSRVQTWLFAVPRLRAMVGANTLLGEALRVRLPELARGTGHGWKLSSRDRDHPGADPCDPLRDADDPARDARDGIVSRDGGHFEAEFEFGAESFVEAAANVLRKELQGLQFRVSINGTPHDKSRVHLSTELPVFAPCEWTGHGLASAIIEQGNERPAVSRDVYNRHRAAVRAEKRDARDTVSLLSATTKLKELRSPNDLKSLVGDGYLALIHADGNSVGSALARDATAVDRARFFHRNRVLLRRAVQTAIDAHCPEDGTAPLIPLMLGGDDLLLVARAAIALPFVVTLCAALEALQQGSKDFKLTLGVGVVIAKHTIPVHRLHEVAEQLASSAKRRYRGLTDQKKSSVVDWAVYNTAWIDDLVEARRRDWLYKSNGALCVLSQRPVDVLGKNNVASLQGLVLGAEKLSNAPRSQLRFLVEELPRGRALSELAFEELPIEARSALNDVGVTAPWHLADGSWITALVDLIEVSEIARLGHTREPADTTSRGRDNA